MGEKRQSATQRRLAHVRALKQQYFGAELTVEEQLAAKDQRISELEAEVELLRLRLERRSPLPEASGPSTEEPEQVIDEPRFNFYRD